MGVKRCEMKNEMKEVKKYIKPNQQRTKSCKGTGGGGGGGQQGARETWEGDTKIKVAQNLLKEILVLGFSEADEFFEIRKSSTKHTTNEPYQHLHIQTQYLRRRRD